MTKVEEFVLGQHLSWWSESETYRSILDAFTDGVCPDDVIIWEVYEPYPTEQIADLMEGLRRVAEDLILDCGGDIDG